MCTKCDDTQKLFEFKIQLSRKSNELEVAPTFTKEGIYFHPLPKKYQALKLFSVGDTVRGRFGFTHPTGNINAEGIPIFVRYFIPEV